MGRAEKMMRGANIVCANGADSRNPRPIKLETLYQVPGCRNPDDNFWGDLSKACIDNLQTSGSYQPKIVRLSAKGRQTMIRRLFAALIAFGHRYWRLCFRPTDEVGEPGAVRARP